MQAAFLLLVSGAFVLGGIFIGYIGTKETATVSDLQAQINRDLAQANEANQQIASLVKRKGEAWVEAHANKLTEVAVADSWMANVFQEDSSLASAEQKSADQNQLAGPAVLSFGSAIFGAVLGWMFTQWLTYLRLPKKSEIRAP